MCLNDRAFAIYRDGEYNRNMAKAGTRRDKHRRHDGMESSATTLVITIAFVFLLVLAIILSSSLIEAENLRRENAVERAYSDILMALRMGGDVDRMMRDEHVLGFGYYTHMGTPLYVWGDAYQRLPLTSFPSGTDINGSYSSYDSTTGVIDTVRYVSSVFVSPENLLRESGSVIEYPDLIYISFDASSYAERVRFLIAISFLACIGILAIYLIVLYIFTQNTRYRETLRRQESLVRLGQAARTLTHEIKNPLSAIRLEVAILKRNVPPSLIDDVAIIDHETDRLTKLTDKVSDYLRNPLGNPQLLDIVQELRILISLFPEGVRLRNDAEEGLLILFDPDRLRSVLENLIKNGVEACEGMDIDVEVSVEASEKDRCIIYVKDKGIGLSESDVKRIFDPFYTTKIHGSGIGLSISQQFVEAAGGRLRLYPGSYGGTTAEVILPLQARS